MAHFAQLDDNNRIVNVVAVDNSVLVDDFGRESEGLGQLFCKNLFGGRWVQCSYNASFRKNYPSIGWVYDMDRDAFYRPEPPYSNWVFDEETCTWKPPVDKPQDGNAYYWDQENTRWVIATP